MLQNTNKKIISSGLSGLFLLALILIGSLGCNTRIEGCLDINADNFDFEAELACKECCTYPFMNLSLTQQWDETNFSNTDTFYDIHDQPYIIHDLKYFLSSWSWQDLEDIVYTIDSLSAACNEGILTYTPDILMGDTRQFSYTLGTIQECPFDGFTISHIRAAGGFQLS